MNSVLALIAALLVIAVMLAAAVIFVRWESRRSRTRAVQQLLRRHKDLLADPVDGQYESLPGWLAGKSTLDKPIDPPGGTK